MRDGPNRAPPYRSDDPRAKRSRAALRAALVDLLGAGSIDKVTVLALTANAGVGYATFFRNYADLDALFADVAQSAIDELALLLDDGTSRTPIEIAQSIVVFFARNRTTLTPLFVGASAVLERGIVVQATRAAVLRSRPPAKALPDALAIAHVVRSTINVLQWWLGDGCDTSPDTIARLIERLAFAPVVASA